MPMVAMYAPRFHNQYKCPKQQHEVLGWVDLYMRTPGKQKFLSDELIEMSRFLLSKPLSTYMYMHVQEDLVSWSLLHIILSLNMPH